MARDVRWVHGRTEGWSWTDCESSRVSQKRSARSFRSTASALPWPRHRTLPHKYWPSFAPASCLFHQDRTVTFVVFGSKMSKPTAAGGAGVGPSRRTWDVEEYTSKARERDREDKERAQQNEERIRKGECGESSGQEERREARHHSVALKSLTELTSYRHTPALNPQPQAKSPFPAPASSTRFLNPPLTSNRAPNHST
jgi:hypothetical protein